MKHNNNKQTVAAVTCLLVVLVGLAGCTADQPVERHWDGTWLRTIHVPRGIAGRCVDEQLHIDKKQWRLKAVLYPTYQCRDPFLELSYSGVLEQVEIKKSSDKRQLTLQVSAIELTEMVDIVGEERAVVSGSALRNLSSRYVPEADRQFRQKVWLGKDNKTMRSDIYLPLLNLAIADYPDKQAQLLYKRQ